MKSSSVASTRVQRAKGWNAELHDRRIVLCMLFLAFDNSHGLRHPRHSHSLIIGRNHGLHSRSVMTRALLSTQTGLTQPPDEIKRIEIGSRQSLLTMPPDALRLRHGWPEIKSPHDKARATWAALRKGVNVLDEKEISESKYLTRRMSNELERNYPPLMDLGFLSSVDISEDGTHKLLIRLADGQAVESVIMKMGQHSSVCVSSQVGCSRGCVFCRTGKMGLLRNLSPEEILVQVWMALRLIRTKGLPQLNNVVFMGMGEPLNNFDAVRTAVNMLVDQQAFALSRRNVLVSTVGPSPALIRKARELPCKIAWSVHAVDDDLRKLLVPTTRHSMVDLRDAFLDVLANKADGRTRNLMVELALMSGINDRPNHADQLVKFLYPFGRCIDLGVGVLVNLIPYNENGLHVNGKLIRSAAMKEVHAFQRKLWEHEIFCTVRTSRGDDKSSACGQLATEIRRSDTRNTLQHANLPR